MADTGMVSGITLELNPAQSPKQPPRFLSRQYNYTTVTFVSQQIQLKSKHQLLAFRSRPWRHLAPDQNDRQSRAEGDLGNSATRFAAASSAISVSTLRKCADEALIAASAERRGTIGQKIHPQIAIRCSGPVEDHARRLNQSHRVLVSQHGYHTI